MANPLQRVEVGRVGAGNLVFALRRVAFEHLFQNLAGARPGGIGVRII